MGSWYIDRSRNISSIFSSEWYSKLEEYANDNSTNGMFDGKSQEFCNYLQLPTKNPYAILTYLRDLGIIDDNNDATDFFKCGLQAKLSAEEFILLILLKRNDNKNEASTVKPFVVLSKALYLMSIFDLPLVINWHQCINYLMSVSSYDEINESLIRSMVDDHGDNPPNGPDIWFNALISTGLFTGKSSEITLKDKYMRFISFIANYGNELEPSSNRMEYIEQSKDALYGIYTLFKNHTLDAAIAVGDMSGIFDYLLVVKEFESSYTKQEALTPEWFKKQAENLATVDQEADNLYKEFQSYFAPSIIKQLTGREILDKIFYSDNKDDHNLCYTLEYDTRYNLFGGIKGGSAYKFGLFYSKERNSWVTGSPNKVKLLSEKEAIALGSSIRNELVSGAEIIEKYGALKDLNDYVNLYAKLFKGMPNLVGKMWAMKYLHMIFPDLFPVFYNGEWQNRILNQLNIEPQEDSFIRMGQIALFVKQCGISNVAFSKVIYKLKATPNTDNEPEEESTIIQNYTFDTAKVGAQNKVVYGTPGCGKSFYVQNTFLNECGVSLENRIRTTFYMDYTNTDFVGQILPKVYEDGDKRTVTYDFNPGPFALALKMAIENPDEAVALVIEELNRGNAASIFGDIFQLLDRDKDGKSQYSITNTNLQGYLNKQFEGQYTFDSIQIPANLYIVATMNTSDQNVFTLDTAFKRRWQFEKLRNKFTNEHKYKDFFVPGMDNITWERLVNSINEFIVNRPDDLSSEDKQLGIYFIDESTLCATPDDCKDDIKIERFAYKLFEYLWDDVAKFARLDWFGDVKTLDQLIDRYKEIGLKVFVEGVIK